MFQAFSGLHHPLAEIETGCSVLGESNLASSWDDHAMGLSEVHKSDARFEAFIEHWLPSFFKKLQSSKAEYDFLSEALCDAKEVFID